MIEKKVEDVMKDVFKLEADTDLSHVSPGSIPQWDSLGHVNLIHGVEEAFSIRFSVDEIAQIDSLDSLKETVKNHVSE